MRLIKARIQKYRSIRDTGLFEVEANKTILVGPNEAGKTALLQALQQLNPPPDVRKFDALRDYPRSEYNDITTKKVNPANVTIVEGHFVLESDDQALLPTEFQSCTYVCGRTLDNKAWARLEGGPPVATYADIKKDLARLCSHVDPRVPATEAGNSAPSKPSTTLETITKGWSDTTSIHSECAKPLKQWLHGILQYVDEANSAEEDRHARLTSACEIPEKRDAALAALNKRVPVFVLFGNYFRVRPEWHLLNPQPLDAM